MRQQLVQGLCDQAALCTRNAAPGALLTSVQTTASAEASGRGSVSAVPSTQLSCSSGHPASCAFKCR